MELKDAFAAGIPPEKLFLDLIPQLHRVRLEQFRQFCDCTLVVSFRFTDTDRRFTLELGRNGASVEAGELVDFPVVTVEGLEAHWEAVKRHVLALFEEADRRADEYVGRVRITQAILDQFERFDGVIELTFTDTGDGFDHVIRVILNDYEASDDAPLLRLSVSLAQVHDLVSGRVQPAELGRRLRVGGDRRLALDLGGFLLKHTGH